MINVVIGAPCSGKSTHINKISNEGDVLIDYDKIAMSIGASASHESKDSIREVALAMRFRAIDKILNGVEADSYIIHTSPSDELMEKYVNANAFFTMLSTTEQECKERAEADNRPDGTTEAIEKWYRNPPNVPNDAKNSLDIELNALLAALRGLKVKFHCE